MLFHERVELTGAGRTDAGVHASVMFAHFDTLHTPDPATFCKRLNALLPKDIAVSSLIPVHPEAHARFDAHSRSYRYLIHQEKDVFLNGLSWYLHRPLNIELMNEATEWLFRYTDFQCFSKSNTDVFTYNCKITEAKWTRRDTQIIFDITADRFLRNMVRAIVGTMVNIGLGKIDAQQMKEIIESKDRSQAGFSVPAHGLYLTDIRYPYIDESCHYTTPHITSEI